MSTPFYQNDLENENLQMETTRKLTSTINDKINNLNTESQLSSERIKEMQETVASLKMELQGVVVKVEQNVGIFKGKITSKIALVLNLLKKKQTHIQNTLDNCYKIIDNLVETFLNVGYELERDITIISLKVNDFDSEMKKMTGCSTTDNDGTLWFINGEGRLTKRKNVVLSSTLPRFKCGDKKMRKSFVYYLTDVFTAFQVPKNLWAKLAANQLVGMAHDWWNMNDKEMKWEQFTKSFIGWTFNDTYTRTNKDLHSLGEDENNNKMPNNLESPPNAYILKQQSIRGTSYSNEICNTQNQSTNNKMDSLNHTSVSKQTVNKEADIIVVTNSNYSLLTTGSEETDEDLTTSSASNKSTKKRKHSIYTAANSNQPMKRRKPFKQTQIGEILSTPTLKKGGYKLRKRK